MAKTITRGEKVIKFIETWCKVPEGKLIGKPIKLDPFQKKFILEIYDNPHGTRRGYLSIARKNGKSGLIAAILLAHIAGPEAKQNTQIVSGAMSRDQASLVFALASKIVQMCPRLSELVRIVPSSKRLIGLARNVEYKALAADGKTAHGLSPILAILDEVGQVRGSQSDFVDAIVTSQGAHAEPLLLAISTQAPNDNDLFSIWIDDAKDSHDPRIVSHVYEAQDDCELLDKAAWKAANPAMGTFRSLEDVEEQAERAARMPSFEPTFRNLILNQRVEMTSPFISRNTWLENGLAPDLEAFKEHPVYVGLDLSAKNDLTAMVAVCFDGTNWHVHSRFWTPQQGLVDRSKRDRAPYDIWASQGLITATPGASINYDQVVLDIAEQLAEWSVAALAFDRWRIDIFKQAAERANITLPLVPFGQGFASMAPAIDRLETELLNKTVRHGKSPVLTMCMANSVIEKDAAGNRKLNKAKSTGRIDGAVALVMAIGAAASNVEKEPSFQMMVL